MKIVECLTNIKATEPYACESLEQKLRRAMTTAEPIDMSAPQIYTERSEGVKPEYDIRTDRWEIAEEAMDKVAASRVAKREQKFGKTEPLQDATGDAPKSDNN